MGSAGTSWGARGRVRFAAVIPAYRGEPQFPRRTRSLSRRPRQRNQRVVAQPVGRPLVVRRGAQAPVEADARLVPVQHPPLEPLVAALHADPRERREQVAAQAGTAVLGPDVQVLEPDPVAPGPGRERHVPERHPDHLAVDLGHVAERRRWALVGEHQPPEVLLRGLDLVQLALVLGQVAHQAQDVGDVGRGRLTDAHGRFRPSRKAAIAFSTRRSAVNLMSPSCQHVLAMSAGLRHDRRVGSL